MQASSCLLLSFFQKKNGEGRFLLRLGPPPGPAFSFSAAPVALLLLCCPCRPSLSIFLREDHSYDRLQWLIARPTMVSKVNICCSSKVSTKTTFEYGTGHGVGAFLWVNKSKNWVLPSQAKCTDQWSCHLCPGLVWILAERSPSWSTLSLATPQIQKRLSAMSGRRLLQNSLSCKPCCGAEFTLWSQSCFLFCCFKHFRSSLFN